MFSNVHHCTYEARHFPLSQYPNISNEPGTCTFRVIVGTTLPQSLVDHVITSILCFYIQASAEQQEEEEEAFADAPEEFIDALTFNLMTDPVTLPSSGITIDKSTIARHLLRYVFSLFYFNLYCWFC